MLRPVAKPHETEPAIYITKKTTVQQGLLCVHRMREGGLERRTELHASIASGGGMLAEFGLVAAKSPDKTELII